MSNVVVQFIVWLSVLARKRLLRIQSNFFVFASWITRRRFVRWLYNSLFTFKLVIPIDYLISKGNFYGETHQASQYVRNLDAPKFQEVLQHYRACDQKLRVFLFLGWRRIFACAAYDLYNCKLYVCSLKTKSEDLLVEFNQNSKRHAKP